MRRFRLTLTPPHSENPFTVTWGGALYTIAARRVIEATHDGHALDVHVDLGWQENRLSAHDGEGPDLNLVGGEVGVAQIQHAATPQRE